MAISTLKLTWKLQISLEQPEFLEQHVCIHFNQWNRAFSVVSLVFHFSVQILYGAQLPEFWH
jgi:hypothetical protein